MRVLVRPTFFWKLMCWWIRLTKGPSNNIQSGTIFYGGNIHIVFYLERPGVRVVVAQTTLTLEQAKCFHMEMGRQIERMEAFTE